MYVLWFLHEKSYAEYIFIAVFSYILSPLLLSGEIRSVRSDSSDWEYSV